MSFKSHLNISAEDCDKCHKPMSTDRPGIYLYASSQEGRQQIWIHIDCLQKAIRKAEKEAIHVEVTP